MRIPYMTLPSNRNVCKFKHYLYTSDKFLEGGHIVPQLGPVVVVVARGQGYTSTIIRLGE